MLDKHLIEFFHGLNVVVRTDLKDAMAEGQSSLYFVV